MENSIFKRYYEHTEFQDRFLTSPLHGITVIIPIIHTNELWETNLKSIFREVPVKKLLIGDGGCAADSKLTLDKFPRVEILDHSSYKSLGYSIRKLIEAVETEWFIYIHSDVYLPTGWFDKMHPNMNLYDWFGCRMQQTIMIEYDNDYGDRPYAGSQIGRKKAFEQGLSVIDDDYVYRQEDFVFSEIIARGDFKEGRIDDVFHYHQLIKKTSSVWNPKNMKVSVSQDLTHAEEARVWETQVKGIVKYLKPNNEWIISDAAYGTNRLNELKIIDLRTMYQWINDTNPIWLPIIKKRILIINIFKKLSLIIKGFKTIFGRIMRW